MTRSKIVQRFGWQLQFLVPKLFWSTFEKIHIRCIFSKVNQKYLATKKIYWSFESLENFTTLDAGILYLHFHQLGPLGRVGVIVAMSVCSLLLLFVCHFPMQFFCVVGLVQSVPRP